MKEQETLKDEGEEAADLKITVVRGGCTSNCPKIAAVFWCSCESCFVNGGSVLDAVYHGGMTIHHIPTWPDQ
jgi:hypothetical protein